MGQSYRKAFETVKDVAARDYGIEISLCGIVDHDPLKTQDLVGGETPVYLHYQEAIQKEKPDLIINALNDDQHFDLFRFLETTPVKGVISEKPFTENLDQAKALASYFKDHFLSLNLVENYSEIIPVFENTLAREHLDGYTLIGVEGVWGKDRTQDTRPTQGIISDMVHPMGLFMRIFGVEGFQTLDGHAVSGPLLQKCIAPEYHDKNVKFEHYVEMTTSSGIPARLDSSYAWRKQEDSAMDNAQDRRVTGFYQKGNSLRVLEFTFDSPVSGQDSVRIYEVHAGAKALPVLLAEKKALNQRLNDTVIDPTLDSKKGGKAKLFRFMLDSILSFAKPNLVSAFNGKRVIGYDAAVETQAFLEEIDQHQKKGFSVAQADPLNEHDDHFRKNPRFKPINKSTTEHVVSRAKGLAHLQRKQMKPPKETLNL